MTEERRRILKTLYRILSTTDDERYKALDRLQTLAGEAAALAVFLHVEQPDPAVVEKWLSFRLAKALPFHMMNGGISMRELENTQTIRNRT